MLEIRKARIEEYEEVKQFYDSLIDHIDMFTYGPMWEKGVYPSYAYIQESIKDNQVYIGLLEDKIISCMIVNTLGNDSYKEATWSLDLKDKEYIVIHALGVDPFHIQKGIGKQMVQYIIKEMKDKYKAIRLDVLQGNLSANRLYESIGFILTDTIQMYYEDTGWTNFDMYEYAL